MRFLIGLGAFFGLMASPVWAAEDEIWTATVKGNVGMSPAYPGSSSLSPYLTPGLGFHRAGVDPGFSAPDDNIGLALFDKDWLKAGPVGDFQGGRKASSHPELHGLNDIAWTIEGGAYVEAWVTPKIRTRLEVMHDFHRHYGFVANAGADYVEKLGAWTLSAGPRLALADQHAMGKYFSVSPGEAAASGTLSAYTAKAGVRSIGAAAAATHQWNKKWTTTLYGRYDYLTGSAAHSPIVTKTGSRNQYSFGLTVAYSFDFKRFW